MLELKAWKYVFLGYPEGFKWYKLWWLEPGHTWNLISRDVVYNEAEFLLRKQIPVRMMKSLINHVLR